MKKLHLFNILLSCILCLFACSKSETPEINISTSQLQVPNDQSSVSFNVSSNVNWTLSQSPSGSFSISPSQGVAGETTVNVSSSPNTGSTAKICSVTITGSGVTKTVSLKQEPISFSLSSSSLDIESTATSTKVTITSNTTWNITKTNLPSWIKSISPESGNGNSTITIETSENDQRVEQKYTLRINYASTFASLLIKKAPAPNCPPSKPELVFPKDGATDIETIPTFKWNPSTDADNDKISYTVSISEDQQNWQTISAGENNSVSLSKSTTIGALKYEAKYYYKVTADDGFYNGKVESNIASFTTGKMDVYPDGFYTVYQQSTKSNPSILIFTGDGYVSEDYRLGGVFDNHIDEAIEGLFKLEPYKTYREYFTVYKIAAYSQERGMSDETIGSYVNTIFGTTKGDGTRITCKSDKVFEYAKKIEGINDEVLQKSAAVAVLINEDIYAGTCFQFSNGSSIGMVPHCTERRSSFGTYFVNLLGHEFGGHGFGRLADEYVNYNTYITEEAKTNIKTWQGFGYSLNVSTTGDPEQVPWAKIIGQPGYEDVNVYHGANYYAFGVFKSEPSSIMIDNRLYYNAQSRYLIFKRIMETAGEDSSLERFIANDVEKTDPIKYNTKSTTIDPSFVPLAPPVRIICK